MAMGGMGGGRGAVREQEEGLWCQILCLNLS